MALHLAAQHEFGRERLDGGFDFEIIVGDQRFEIVEFRRVTHVAGEFAIVAAEADDGETQFVAGNAGGGNGVRRVPENENALGGQVSRVDRTAIPGEARGIGGERGGCINARGRRDFAQEIARGAMADWDRADRCLPERLFEPACGGVGDFGVHQDVDVGIAQPREVGGAGVQRRNDVHINT